MSQENIETVKALYAAFGRRDMGEIVKRVSPSLEIVQSSELPWGGTYRGVEGLQQFFGKLMAHLDNRGLPIERYLDAGDHVVAIGRTQGTVKANGKQFDVPLAHVWQIRDGRAVRFSPCIDNPAMLACLAP
jgi:ketosteroid isomerase-like protein